MGAPGWRAGPGCVVLLELAFPAQLPGLGPVSDWSSTTTLLLVMSACWQQTPKLQRRV